MDRRLLRFGVFELDPESGELRRSGVRIRVQDQPFRILVALLEKPGEIVTREELRTRIWGETFVDYDRALNTAIKKLRAALGDSAESPRFIETLASRGYRFIAEVHETPLPRAGEGGAKRRVRGFPIAIVGAVIALIAGYILTRPPNRNIRALAVLPFVNLTGDAANEYISDGITETLIADLGHLASLQVISRTTAMQYKNAKKSIPQIASELGVDGIVEGSLLRFGETVRVEVKLVDAARDALLWSEQYERARSDLDALQHDVAAAIAAQLRARLDFVSPQAPSSEAYLLYLKGRHWLSAKRGAEIAATLFRDAIAKDPTYAAPYAGLAEVEMFAPAKNVPPREALERAKVAAEKSVALDPSLAVGHSALGMVRMFLDRDFVAAEREFRRAIELNPGAAEPHHRFGQLLAALGRFEEALAEAKRATELDPYSSLVIADYGRVLYFARRFAEAEKQYQRARSIDPNDRLPFWFLMQAYEAQNKHDLVVQGLREIINPDRRHALDEAYRRGGYAAILRAWAEIVERDQRDEPFVRTSALAARFARAGDRERAFEWLERAYRSHTRDLVYLGVEPAFDGIRDDARFAAMLRKVGLR